MEERPCVLIQMAWSMEHGSRRIRFTETRKINLWRLFVTSKGKVFPLSHSCFAALFFRLASTLHTTAIHSKWWQRWKINFHENSSNVCSAWITFAYSRSSLDLSHFRFCHFHMTFFSLSGFFRLQLLISESELARPLKLEEEGKIANCVSFMWENLGMMRQTLDWGGARS